MFPRKKKNENSKWNVRGKVRKGISKWPFPIESKRGLGEAIAEAKHSGEINITDGQGRKEKYAGFSF
jgi:hypothetical protein